MHIAVLAAPDSWYWSDLQRAAGEEHQICRAAFGRLTSRLTDETCSIECGDVDLSSVDCVLVRSMPPGSLEQVVFRMDALGRLAAAGTLVVNPPRALEAAIDKYLTSAKLQAAGIPIPRTVACQTVEDAMAAFAFLGGDVVVKPLFGSEGRGIARVTDEAIALHTFQALVQLSSVLYLQEFVPHDGFDLRLLTIGSRILAMKRINPADWRTNVARGAVTEPFRPTDAMRELALSAAHAVGAPFAGVDLLLGRDGRLLVLEVNAVPGWKALAATLQVDVAAMLLDYLEAIASG